MIGEWAFIAAHSDTLHLRIDRKVLDLLASHPPETRPSLFIMLSNYVPGADSSKGDFDADVVRRFLANPVARANAIPAARILLLLVALAFLINAGLGIYHAGVEWKWWPGPTTCAGGFDL